MYHLAVKGASVVGIDRFTPPHAKGSSHGQTRIIRNAYFEHPDYVPLLSRAYQLWRNIEQESGERLFDEIGLIEAGPPDGALMTGINRAAAEHGCPVEFLDHRRATELYPMFRIPDHHEIVFERNAGLLHVEACVGAHLDVARARGATLRSDTVVRSIEPDGAGVKVVLDDEVLLVDRVVVTAGAWARDLLEALPVELRVIRKSLFWFEGADPGFRVEAGFPVFAFETSTGFYYGFPWLDHQGVKLAQHGDGPSVDDPGRVDRDLDDLALARVEEFAQAYLQKSAGPLLRHAVCMYTMTPDEHFIVDAHPDHEQIVFAAGLSGHGFKFASVLGEILAELALEGVTRQPTEFLRSARFGSAVR